KLAERFFSEISPGARQLTLRQRRHDVHPVEPRVVLGIFVEWAIEQEQLALVGNQENPRNIPEIAVTNRCPVTVVHEYRPLVVALTAFASYCCRCATSCQRDSAAGPRNR